MSDIYCEKCDFKSSSGLCIVHRWKVTEKSPICSLFRKTYPGTIFQKVTKSPETLAKATVHPVVVEDLCIRKKRMCYTSPFVAGHYNTETDAYAATVEYLKQEIGK